MSNWTKALAIGKPDTIGTMIYGPHGASVAWCGCGSAYDSDGSYSISPAEAHANAKLYAAAPELVDALKIARDYMSDAISARQNQSWDARLGGIPKMLAELAQVDAALAKAVA